MSEVKALYPIGKTQWAKWRAEQRIAFNETRAAGVPFADAVDYVNRLKLVEVNIAPKPEKKKNIFDKIGDAVEDVVEVAETVTNVAAAVTPVVAVAKTVARATSKKKAK
jgi:hypothetical protein